MLQSHRTGQMQEHIDLQARRKAARLIRGFVCGELTNDEIDNEYPDTSGDRAVTDIYYFVWAFWSDLSTHKVGRLNKQSNETFDRILLFLETDVPYRWRDLGFHSIWNPWLWAARLRLMSRYTRTAFHLGEYSAWPFFSHAELREHSRR